MNYNIDQNYQGFILNRIEFIKEIKSTALIFTHQKSGARLIKLENDDNNKVFSITFKTPPYDDTGLPHILEHSVLCGSRKFKTKEPFVDLLKGSLSTFLNAMTFSDKTMYPVASMNEKDFFNLIDVYLDAVFYPNIYNNPMILMQEGWHYDIEKKEDPLSIKGVVYNEMKGAFSSPERLLNTYIQTSLFPDTIYGFESGGNPDIIHELTYDKFIDFHKKYYHPSNSYIYLSGNGDVLKELEFINTQYLKNFDKININPIIELQKPFDGPIEISKDYSLSENEKIKNKSFFSLNFTLSKITDPELYLAFSILDFILMDTPASPLKNELLKSNIGKDVFSILETDILQIYFSIITKHSNLNNKDKFEKIVFKTMENLVKKGIDKNLIHAGINHHEFIFREADFGYPKGLGYNIICLTSWLYGEDPLMHLKFENTFTNIKQKAYSNFFESLINEYFLKNKQKTLLILNPKKNLLKEKELILKKKLSDIKNNLPDNEIEEIIEINKNLKKYQSCKDDVNSKNTIPCLSLNDIKKDAEHLPLEEIIEQNVKILYHPVHTNGIAYLNLFFNVRVIEQDKIQYISLLTEILGKINTKNQSYSDLSNMINIYTGGIEFYNELFISKDDDNQYNPFLVVESKALIQNIPILIDLIIEIINDSLFNNKKRMKELILEAISSIEISMMSQGSSYAKKRLYSYYSQAGMYDEITDGISYYEFIKKIGTMLDKDFNSLCETLSDIAKKIFNKNNLLISITIDKNDYLNFQNKISTLLNSFPDNKQKTYEYNFKTEKLNEGILSSSLVQYVVKGYNYKKLGFNYSGKLQVLRTIIGLDYLWNKIRVLGGAYGSFIEFERNGRFNLGSYRDPNLKETINSFDQITNYLESLYLTENEIIKYIIGTIKRYDRDLTPKQKGERATDLYLCGITYDFLQHEREEILSTKHTDIKNMIEFFKKINEEKYLCVFGNENKIHKEKELFLNLKKIFD